MIHTVRDRIPEHAYRGKSADFWNDILEHLISNIMKKTGCSRSDLIFKFNNSAYREIYYKFMTTGPYYNIETRYNPIDMMTSGTVLGVDFEVKEEFGLVLNGEAVITLETKQKSLHWMDEYFKPIVDTDTLKKMFNAEFGSPNKMSDFYVDRFKNKEKPMKIKKVIFNDPATIVFWDDGTKTVVKCMKGETFDPEKGILVAWYKKLYGDKPNYMKDIKKWAETYNYILPEDPIERIKKWAKGE